MPKHIYTQNTIYNSDDLYDLVVDIKSYPEFIPWIMAARILEQQDDLIIAELLIKYQFFRSSYISKVTLIPKKEIMVKLVQGPFKYLHVHWKFIQSETASSIELILDFEFKAKILENLISKEFDYYSNKIMNAFLERAAFIRIQKAL